MTAPESPAARRGLGPFTGGQLTTIVVAALLAVALPAGAFATVGGSTVFLTDHATGAQAKVTATGELQTAPMTPAGGTYAYGVAYGTGTTSISKDCGFLVVPAGKAFVVTAVQLMSGGSTGGATTGGTDDVVFVNTDSKANCAAPTSSLTGGAFAADAPQSQTFSPGIGLKAGTRLDLYDEYSPTNYYAVAWVYGYFESAAQCGAVCNHAVTDAVRLPARLTGR